MRSVSASCVAAVLLAGTASFQGAFVSAADPPAYDIVIRGGRVVDGTGNPWFYADVAIRGDRIAAIGRVPAGAGKREIDARGLVVSPGFIDIHSHSDWLVFEDGAAESKIRQGVTTDVLGEGTSPGPFQGPHKPHPLVTGSQTIPIRRMKDYFDAFDAHPAAINVASFVGINNVWQSVMGEGFDRPTPEQFKQMEALLDEAMQDGALGLSTYLMMPPGSLATTADLTALCRVVARRGGIYSTHSRNEGTGVFEAVKEAIEIGRGAKLPVDIIHFKIADQKFWGKMPELIALVEAARAEGLDIQTNVYPYTRGNNNLSSIIPPWAHEGGKAKLLERLKDPAQRQRLKHDIQTGIEGWYNHYTAVGGDWSRMLISDNHRFSGLTMDRVLALRKADKTATPDPLDELIELLVESGGSVATVFAHHTEEDMNAILVQPWCSLGSDGSAMAIAGPLRRGNPHPRNFGTFPRVLGHYVRERKLLTLENAVRKMTSLNAAKIGLVDRGTLRAGAFADVTIFDPGKVIDRSTYTEPFQYNEGIEYVLVNGQLTLAQGERPPARPGRALRHVAAE